MNKIDILVLSELNKKEVYSMKNSLTIYKFDIARCIKSNTLYKVLVKLEKLDLVKKGLKENRKNTYFITDLGIETLKNIK